ncbi:hypothetical protein N6H14_02410 [Paenibacillus sp. CC-CFT747]|nr:hypothetical protein N6H14_02410 [Paenibacillus sp. CC-CFT747]
MATLKELLLQLFIMLIPYVAFNTFYLSSNQADLRRFVTVISVLCLFLSMSMHSTIDDGIYLDGRYVLMYFGLVFGGIPTGFILLLEFLVFRFSLGGSGLLSALISTALTFPLSIYSSHLYHKIKNKAIITVTTGILCCFIPTCVLISIYPTVVKENFLIKIVFVAVQNGVGIWLLTSLFAKSISDREMSFRYAQTEKIEAVSQVAASLVHEVRNPLTAVKGF